MKNRGIARLIIFILVLFSGSVRASEIIIGLSNIPNNLSPFFGTDANSQNINRLLHKSLIDLDENMKFICILCEDYREVKSKDRYSIYFKLKENLTFWDGGPVTSKHVLESVRYFTSPDINSIFRFAFRKIKKVNIISKYEFELIYGKFELDHLSNLVLLKILKIPFSKTHRNPIGIGEYRLARPGELTMELHSKKGPNLIFKVVRDETTMALKLINQEVDVVLGDMSPRKINWILKNYSEKIMKWENQSTNFVYINPNHKSPLLKEKKMREALSLLIPRRDMLKYKLKGNGLLAKSIFSPAFKDVFIDFDIDEYNPELARTYFKELGYELKNNHYQRDGKPLTLNWIVSNNKGALELVHVIKNSFEKENIQVNLEILEWGNFMRRYKRGQFDLVMAQWVGFTGPDILNFVFSSEMISPKGGNRGHYINKEVDRLLDLAIETSGNQKRNSYFKKILKKVNEDYAYINLWHPSVVWLARTCLNPVKPFPNGSFIPLSDIKKVDCKK